MRIATLAVAAIAVMLLTGCDPTADFVFGTWDNGGHEFVLDASSGPSGEHPQGTVKLDDQLFGTVGCVQVSGSEARVGLDLSPSLGENALAIVTDTGTTSDVIRLSPTGIAASQICNADLEPGPPQAGNFIVHDLVP